MSKAQARFTTLIGVLAVLGGAFACAEFGGLTAPSTPAGAMADRVAGADGDEPDNAKVLHAKARGDRAGRIHHAAMQELLANLPAAGPKAGRLARHCDAAAQLTLRQMPAIEEAYGVTWTPSLRRQLVTSAFRSIGPCKAHASMSLFGAASYADELTVGMDVEDEPGTEAVIAPINALTEAVKNSDGSVAAVEAITAASLQNNSNLGSVDLEILANVAAVANSSAAEWNAYSAQGGFGNEYWEGEWDWNASGGIGGPSGCGEQCEYPQAIFAGFWRKAGFVVGSDVIGCGTGALATWWSGAAGAGASCVIWGVGTSAVSLLGVLLI